MSVAALAAVTPDQTLVPLVDAVALPHGPVSPSIGSRVIPACLSHAARDFAGQAAGRLLGLASFSLLATTGSAPLRVANALIGMAAGGRIAYLIASRQFGDATPTQLAGTGCATALGMMSGALIAATGHQAAIAALGAGSLVTAIVSWTAAPDPERGADPWEGRKKLAAAAAGTVAGWVAGAALTDGCGVSSAHLPARNLGLLVESGVIELCKSAFERVGPSVDRSVLSFEGRVAAAMLGMAPYVAATVVLNGYVSGRLQPAHDSSAFGDLALPLVVGALANSVRGFCNALAVEQLHRHGKFVARTDAECVRASQGPKTPDGEVLSDKASIRLLLSASRNAIYAQLREAGLSITDAGELAQGVYACFAQCRDLIHDIARGDGWSAPVIASRTLPAVSLNESPAGYAST